MVQIKSRDEYKKSFDVNKNENTTCQTLGYSQPRAKRKSENTKNKRNLKSII